VLSELYLDLYDNVLMTDEGINALSDSLQELKALQALYIDLSGYPFGRYRLVQLTEDGLELLFGSLVCTNTRCLTINVAKYAAFS
jgi:hypothetical protein